MTVCVYVCPAPASRWRRPGPCSGGDRMEYFVAVAYMACLFIYLLALVVGFVLGLSVKALWDNVFRR